MYELSFSALSLARRVSRCELKLVSCMLVLMFAGGLGDLYTEDSMYVLLWTLASMVIVSNTLSIKVESSATSLNVMAFFIESYTSPPVSSTMAVYKLVSRYINGFYVRQAPGLL